MQAPENMSLLDGLQPGTTYEVMVCRQTFNLSTDLPPPGRNPFIIECAPCFATETPFYDFDSTEVTRLNDTYIRLLCEVKSNVPHFTVNWSVRDEATRRGLMNGSLVDEKPVSISDTSRDGSVKSSLTAPDDVLMQDVQCTASSDGLGTQSSERGAFVAGNHGYQRKIGSSQFKVMPISLSWACNVSMVQIVIMLPPFTAPVMTSSPDPFPIWAIILVAIASALTIACLVVTVTMAVGILLACSRTRPRHFEPESIQR